ncbi:MAG: hypothetical protein F6K38_38600, partial [Moorea sp. SIO3B2]|nr:hypothetical protein [Moorena sp. SIO3B2]
MVRGSAFAHPTPQPQGRWANPPDSSTNCQRISICPPYATIPDSSPQRDRFTLFERARCPLYPFPIPDSRFPIPDSRFPIPDSRFPIPDSRFPIPDSRFPIPDSRFPL